MSDTITPDERALWASVATARINAVTPERQCEITAQERLVKALKALEQAEARAEKAERRNGYFMSRLMEAGRLVSTDDEFYPERIPDLVNAAIEQLQANVARLTKALETQRNLTASAHATAQAAWGGEIPSPFPGHKPPSEDAMVERFNHLNCPLCGGSGHIDDCDQTSAETIARLTKMVDWLANQLDCPPEFTNCEVDCIDYWKEAARLAVAAGEE